MIAVNLIPETVAHARRRRRRCRAWSLALLLAAGVCAVPVSVELSRHRRVQSLRDERQRVQADMEKTRDDLNRIGLEIQSLQAQKARADALRTKRPWTALFALLSRSLPDEMWLMSAATDPAAPPRGHHDRTAQTDQPEHGDHDEPEVVILEAPRRLVLDGYAIDYLSLLRFMSDLNRAEVFQTVSLTRAVDEPAFNATAVRFKIFCEW